MRVIIFLKSTGKKVKETASYIYKTEKELFNHVLTLTALIILIFGATYTDSYFKPKLASASQTLDKADSKIERRYEGTSPPPTEQSSPAGNTVAEQPAPTPPAPPSNLPPPLTQNTQNLNPVLLGRFDAFRTFIFQTYGVVLEIKSGWRSYEEQLQLFRSLPRGYANPPGRSQHERGEAIDYTPYSPEYNQHLSKFGLMLPYPGKENWHVERVEPH